MPQTCIRRPGSRWTLCRCTPCRRRVARLQKLQRAGLLRPREQDAATTRLDHWIALGASCWAIAELSGVQPNAALHMVRRRRAGRPYIFTYQTARTILEAGDLMTARTGTMDASGTRRRLRALATLGWSLGAITDHSGIQHSSLAMIRLGRAENCRTTTAAAVARVYDALWSHAAPPSGPATQARRHALRSSWESPLAWDDDSIDDPQATPQGLPQRHSGGQAKLPHPDDIDELVRVRGWDHRLIAEHYSVGVDTVKRAMSPSRRCARRR